MDAKFTKPANTRCANGNAETRPAPDRDACATPLPDTCRHSPNSAAAIDAQPLRPEPFCSVADPRRAQEQTRLCAEVLDHHRDAIFITDTRANILTVNHAFTEITGYTAEKVIGNTPRLLDSGRHSPDFYREMWAETQKSGFWQGEIWNKRRNGEARLEWLTLSAVYDAQGKITHYIGILSDIRRHATAEEHVSYLTHHDSLTGLPDRALMQDQLARMLDSARAGNQTGLMFLGLDRFKMINSSLGHHVGDLLLRAVAQRLTGCVRRADTVSRLGSDEFAVILPGLADCSDAARIAQKILTGVADPYRIDGHDINVTASIGIALSPGDGREMHTLIRNADTAVYHAKESGRNNYQFFTPDMNAWISGRLTVENNLRRALEREEFTLHYQPQVNLQSGRIIGVEALLRWQHPEMGIIPPAEFIPVAEECGLIIQIGQYVLHAACRQNRTWQAQGLRAIPMAINVSALQFHDKNFHRTVSRTLTETGLDPCFLELEVTEGVVMRHGDTTVGELQKLKSLGVQLSIDDFGTGYSSLNYLKRFPIGRLKIDRSFICDITHDPSDAEIVKAVIALGHSLKLRVMAEGVETAEQLAFLRSEQCDGAQGYYFSRPLPAEAFACLLRADRRLCTCSPINRDATAASSLDDGQT